MMAFIILLNMIFVGLIPLNNSISLKQLAIYRQTAQIKWQKTVLAKPPENVTRNLGLTRQNLG